MRPWCFPLSFMRTGRRSPSVCVAPLVSDRNSWMDGDAEGAGGGGGAAFSVAVQSDKNSSSSSLF